MMRQRLVGTLVLLCGGVILWSLLFTGPAEYKLDRSSQIPPVPRVETPQESEPRIPQNIASGNAPIVEPQPVIAPAADEAPSRFNGEGVKAASTPPEREPRAVSQPEVSAPKRRAEPEPQNTEVAATPEKAAVPPAEPSAEARGLPVAWVIQCGSFGQQSNAENLAKRLRDGGYKAYTEPLKRSSGTLYRVLVGPALNRERAESLQAEINRRFELKSILSRFEG